MPSEEISTERGLFSSPTSSFRLLPAGVGVLGGAMRRAPGTRVGALPHEGIRESGPKSDRKRRKVAGKGWVNGEYEDRDAWVEGFVSTFEDIASEGIVSNCIRSMPKRLEDVVLARGGPTKW